MSSQQNSLFVSGQKRASDEGTQYLHRGIATRSFKQSFNLADHVKVSGAQLEYGQLTIELVREVSEAMKPRRTVIATSNVASADDQAGQSEDSRARKSTSEQRDGRTRSLVSNRSPKPRPGAWGCSLPQTRPVLRMRKAVHGQTLAHSPRRCP